MTQSPSADPRPAGRRRPWRVWLAVGLAILFTPFVLAVGVLGTLWARADISTAGTVAFTRPLVIPPLATSHLDANGRRVFDLRLQAGTTDFGLDRPTATWGINGSYLGPTLRAKRGEQVAVNVTNDLGQTTTLHWHGMHLPAAMDGGPHQRIEPGATWSPSWTINQPATTLWYHPHLHGATAQHVYRGLAGLFILDDSPSAALPLPRDYGIDDIPVIVQDKSFTGDGQLDQDTPLFSPTGVLGDTILVNGTRGAYQQVTTERVRLRLLNASNARIYNFGLADERGQARGFALIGTDGGLLPAPVQTTRVQLSPGERAEIVVTMRPGERTLLRSYPAELGADFWTQRFSGGDDILDILELRAAGTLTSSAPLPATLAPAPDLQEDDATTTRTFAMDGSRINRQHLDMERIDEVVTVGDTEIWQVMNNDGTPHNFHVHDVQFQILDLDGAPPPATLAGRKDTVYVAPGTTVRLLMRFADYTDPDTPYMFHCHVLRHEDRGMMGQFVVVAPGQQPGQPTAGSQHAAGHRDDGGP
jgi:suppressor of ftsI